MLLIRRKDKLLSNEGIRILPLMLWIQCFCFFILYAIWTLPETILIRHLCLIVGAIIGIYEIYLYRRILLSKHAIPIGLICCLFIWMFFHLIVLATDYDLQYQEFKTIWKRGLLGVFFAFGLGLSLASLRINNKNLFWFRAIIYLGLLMPSLIYIIKYVFSFWGSQYGWSIPPYLGLYSTSAPFYIPKTAYVCFCLPILAVSFGLLANNIRLARWLNFSNIVYLLTIQIVFFIFSSENIKNGMMYGAFLFLIFIFQLVRKDFHRHWRIRLISIGVLVLISTYFFVVHAQKNDSWQTLFADAQVAVDIDRYSHWKYDGTQGYPNNKLGNLVSTTNYVRIAWAVAGVKLLISNPLGYGLVERSFGHLAKNKWPDTNLHQSHSGWIDLALGVGLPGVLLILSALIILLFQLRFSEIDVGRINFYFIDLTWWILFSLLIMWFTTEISQKVFFDHLLFWLGFGSGVNIAAFNR